MLKVLHLSTYDDKGGAAKAAYRIHKSQQALGIDSTLMVLSKTLNDPSVVLPSSFDHFSKLINKIQLDYINYPRNFFVFPPFLGLDTLFLFLVTLFFLFCVS